MHLETFERVHPFAFGGKQDCFTIHVYEQGNVAMSGAGGLVREIAPSYFANGDFTGSFFYIDVNETPLKVKNLYASKAYEQYVNKTREWYKIGCLKDSSFSFFYNCLHFELIKRLLLQ